MSVKTSRASEVAEVVVDNSRCTKCWLCVRICKGGPLRKTDEGVGVDQTVGFGCIGCGHCSAICPNGCITVSGRDLLPEDIVQIPGEPASFDSLNALMMARRSVREFEPGPLEPEQIDRILEAASTAPMGIPPSDVCVLAFRNPVSVRQFKDDCLEELKRMQWMFRPLGLALMRPLVGKEAVEQFSTFLKPLVESYVAADEAGEDLFLYDAPAAFMFYGTAYSDPADPVIAATYAMLAAESMGLGTCMIGFPGLLLQRSKRLKDKYAIAGKIQPGVALILGRPAVRFRKGIKRRFARVQDY